MWYTNHVDCLDCLVLLLSVPVEARLVTLNAFIHLWVTM